MKNLKNYLMNYQDLKRRILDSKISLKFVFIVTGIASTLWFLARVIPKPQRAAYPCMRAAAPIMSGFVLYLLSVGGITLLFKKFVSNMKRAKYGAAVVALLACLVILAVFNIREVEKVYSQAVGFKRGDLPDGSNKPMGEGRGVFPGRVVWTWNPAATNEDCKNVIVSTGGWSGVMDWDKSDAFIQSKNNNQDTINRMADQSILGLSGESTVAAGWDAIFKNFNERKTGTASGYTEGQTIFIKVNNGQAGWAINMSDMSEKGNNSSTGVSGAAMSGTTPATVVALIRQLVDEAGVPQNKIYVGEPMTHVYKSMYDAVHNAYPNVIVLDKENHTDLGRTTTSGWTSNAIQYSDKGEEMPDGIKDAYMNEMYNADYLINVAALKAHARNGVTFGAKLHFGSHGDHGGNDWGSFDLHKGLIATVDNDVMTSGVRGEYGMYRVLTDLMGHEKLGGNTVLFIVDGLWGGIEATDMPVKWKTAPFNNDFPNSLFMSLDGVAIESVCLDFLRAEADVNTAFKDRPFFPAVDDHLHQAAERANWPTEINYDPENDGSHITSLGVHEHWNNSTNKQYSKNLFSNGTGIDLFAIPASLITYESTVANILTITVTSNGTAIEDAIITINGLKYLSNSEGKVIIGNMTNVTDLSFTVQKQGYVTFDGKVTISGDTDVNADLEGISIGVDSKNSNTKFSVYPNPCTTETTVSYKLNENAKVLISVFALDGKLVKTIPEQQMVAGNYTNKLNTDDLKSGMYLCTITISTKNTSEKRTLKIEVK